MAVRPQPRAEAPQRDVGAAKRERGAAKAGTGAPARYSTPLVSRERSAETTATIGIGFRAEIACAALYSGLRIIDLIMSGCCRSPAAPFRATVWNRKHIEAGLARGAPQLP